MNDKARKKALDAIENPGDHPDVWEMVREGIENGGRCKLVTERETMKLPSKITVGDKYNPAMEMVEQAEADEYFEVCVAHSMGHGKTREEAETLERSNLGYYAGYFGGDTQERVQRLFKCLHPIFGSITKKGQPTPEEALTAGCEKAAETNQEKETDG